jgi:hypothetical protein
VEQLERDNRLQRDKPPALAQQGIEALLTTARLLRQIGAHYAAAYARPNNYPIGEADRTWATLQEAYLAIHPSPTEDRVDLVVRCLEATEQPAPAETVTPVVSTPKG